MTAAKKTKETETETTNETVEQKAIALVSIGVCPIVLAAQGVTVAPGEQFEVTEEQLETAGISHLILRGDLEFLDDQTRTAKFRAELKAKVKAKAEPKTVKEAEEAFNKEF